MIECTTKVADLPWDTSTGVIKTAFPINKAGLEVYGVHATFYEGDEPVGCLAFDFNPTEEELWKKFEKYSGKRTENTEVALNDWTAETQCV